MPKLSMIRSVGSGLGAPTSVTSETRRSSRLPRRLASSGFWLNGAVSWLKAMALPVPLRELVFALEGVSEESTSYLNLDTGEVFTITHEIMSLAEDLDDSEDPDLPEWQLQEFALAKRILDSERYKALPSKFDIHEWAIMQDFARSANTTKAGEELRNVIHGAGAFRRFKDAVRRHGIEDAWYQFREEALREIMRDWCNEHDIAFDETDDS